MKPTLTRSGALVLGGLVLSACGAAPPVLVWPAEPPTPPATPLCRQYDADQLHARPESVGSVVSTEPPVRVHYCHPSLQPKAQRLLDAAARSYRIEVGELGFHAPLPDGVRGGGPEVDLYLINLGRAGRAQANEEPERQGDPTAPAYVVIDYRTPEAHGLLDAYAAHELNHVLQSAVGTHVAPPFMEATATYIDDRLYPEAGVLPAMVADFQRAPHRPLFYHDEDSCYDYGAALFVEYLVRRFDLALVAQVYRAGQEDYLTTLNGLLAARGQSLEEALREFARFRVRTGRYQRAGFFPEGQRFEEVTLDRVVSPYEFLGAPLIARPKHAPEILGSVYLGVDLITPLEGGIAIDIHADPGPGRLAVDLLGSDSGEPLDGALLHGGELRTLAARGLRPGMRLWLAVTNLDAGPPRLRRSDAAAAAHGFTARFRRLPEPEIPADLASTVPAGTAVHHPQRREREVDVPQGAHRQATGRSGRRAGIRQPGRETSGGRDS